MPKKKPDSPSEPPDLKDQPRPSFLEVLETCREEMGGNVALAKAITEAYRKNMVDPTSYEKEFVVERRKLKRLIKDHRKVTLSMVELEALHAFLERHQHGLMAMPFFTHTSVVQELADQEDVMFLLGSGMSLEGPDLSHWDVHGAILVRRTLAFANIRFDQIHVPRFKVKPEDDEEPEWPKLLAPRSKPSIIMIGSERSNPATLQVLRRMLGLRDDKKTDWNLPFYFLFDPKDGHDPFSLSRPLAEAKSQYPQLVADIKKGRGWGLAAGGEGYLSDATTRKEGGKRILVPGGTSYAVMAAQRQSNGRIFVVVAGLTGPGTLAAAAKISAMPGALPGRDGKYKNAVLWCVLKSHFDMGPMMRSGRLPKFDSEFIIESKLWDPKVRCEIK